MWLPRPFWFYKAPVFFFVVSAYHVTTAQKPLKTKTFWSTDNNTHTLTWWLHIMIDNLQKKKRLSQQLSSTNKIQTQPQQGPQKYVDITIICPKKGEFFLVVFYLLKYFIYINTIWLYITCTLGRTIIYVIYFSFWNYGW